MKKVLLLLMTVIILGGCQNTTPHVDKYDNSQKEDYAAKDNQTMEVILTVNDQDFVISLEQNDATQALVEQLPICSSFSSDLSVMDRCF